MFLMTRRVTFVAKANGTPVRWARITAPTLRVCSIFASLAGRAVIQWRAKIFTSRWSRKALIDLGPYLSSGAS